MHVPGSSESPYHCPTPRPSLCKRLPLTRAAIYFDSDLDASLRQRWGGQRDNHLTHRLGASASASGTIAGNARELFVAQSNVGPSCSRSLSDSAIAAAAAFALYVVSSC